MGRWQKRLSGVILLACLPLGCAAPMTETIMPVPPPVRAPAPTPPAGPSTFQQVVCFIIGGLGERMVGWRDTEHLTLPQALDKVDADAAAAITAHPHDQEVV